MRAVSLCVDSTVSRGVDGQHEAGQIGRDIHATDKDAGDNTLGLNHTSGLRGVPADGFPQYLGKLSHMARYNSVMLISTLA
ncbi:hypothetical protein E2C01_005724 [Portunus trituberculatus]|uniref:Uncharacterized protein n=1 Tax=Portunus trituberculatus TaxID=210409 RepID=A0A5B7CXD0_PORTR|nr:hypothetical protein [Portunus trituberculatus]